MTCIQRRRPCGYNRFSPYGFVCSSSPFVSDEDPRSPRGLAGIASGGRQASRPRPPPWSLGRFVPSWPLPSSSLWGCGWGLWAPLSPWGVPLAAADVNAGTSPTFPSPSPLLSHGKGRAPGPPRVQPGGAVPHPPGGVLRRASPPTHFLEGLREAEWWIVVRMTGSWDEQEDTGGIRFTRLTEHLSPRLPAAPASDSPSCV